MTHPQLENEPNPRDGVDSGWPGGPLSPALGDLARAAGRLLGLSAFVLSIVGGEAPIVRGKTILGEMDDEVVSALLYAMCLGVVDGEPMIAEDTRQVERTRDAKAFKAAGVGSCLCFPLRANGWQVIGLLCMVGPQPRPLRPAEMSVINDIAQLAAIEIRREAGVEIYSGNELHLQTRRTVLSGLLNENPSERAIGELLGGLCRNLRWNAGSAWFTGAASVSRLSCVGRWPASQYGVDAFAPLYESLSYESEDMLGQVCTRQEPVWFSDLTTLTNIRRADLAREAGFNTGLWFPVINSGTALGVIELLATQAHPEHDRLPLFVLALGRQIGELVGLLEGQRN